MSNVATMEAPAPIAVAPASARKASLVEKFAARYSIDAGKLLTTLKATAFRQKDGEVTNEQMAAMLVVADQYGLNPFTREIFAFPDKGSIVPVVGIDGWSRIINDHAQFDGMDIEFAEAADGSIPQWCEVKMYRKDRSHPITVREYFSEVKRDTPPWKSHPRRMLRHKTVIQASRVAFGFSGIYDEDEAQRIVEANDIGPTVVNVDRGTAGTDAAKAAIARAKGAHTDAGQVIDVDVDTAMPDAEQSAEPREPGSDDQ